ncbi:YCF48-related protein [Dactylosporangium sp. CA-092794]|uniref:YCF48-related protein n=1 Tax=Dactylosporangium sp. CA-092794 TaxID=3239929 RepID=UPI003D90FA65
MKRLLGTVLVGCTLLPAGGCARLPAGDGAGADPLPVKADESPVDAALVTADFGWVLTTRRLLLTRDGGRSFSVASLPGPAGVTRAAAFLDDRTGLTVTASGDAIVAYKTDDGGATWRPTLLRERSGGMAGYSAVAVAVGDSRFSAILAKTATSQAFSLGTIFATQDGGASWAAAPAPEAGRLAVEPTGRIWLAGEQLNLSTDQGRSWTRAGLDLPAATSGTTAISTPVRDVLPVTRSLDGQSEVDLLTSPDQGFTWGRATRVAIRARTGGRARIPVASTAEGPTVFDTVAGHAYRVNAKREIAPSGLPEGVDAVTFAANGSAGWALAHYGTCSHAKRD